MNTINLWDRYRKWSRRWPELGLTLDLSRMAFPDATLESLEPQLELAHKEMLALEAGAIANPDEGRMVGHYWLRSPELAPDPRLSRQIEDTVARIHEFAALIHSQELVSPNGRAFTDVLLIGIGGSALGPQLVSDALGSADDCMAMHFFDNTDPDGMDRILGQLKPHLDQVLVLVISKSGGTAETRNGMLEAQHAYDRAGLSFAKHAVAITSEGSRLDRLAREDAWLARFPMWDWVGGRTSVTSAVGLLPAALQGVDIEALLEGAREMDVATRERVSLHNPAHLLAAMWHYSGGGRGNREMVVLPYRDRLVLFSRYLQQLVMESLGKNIDRRGNPVCQGLTVYGNKGATDQHAYVQQLRDGLDNFFVTFIRVLRDRKGCSIEVTPEATTGDYLQGFYLGTRQALSDRGRESLTLTLDGLSAHRLGGLIALYERAVGIYASLIDVNAYHQPGVEAGKTAAARVLEHQVAVLAALRFGISLDAQGLATQIGASEETEIVYHVLEHLAANGRIIRENGPHWLDDRFRLNPS